MTQEDFCNITIRLEDCTFALIRQVENVALVRSFRSIPIYLFVFSKSIPYSVPRPFN